MTVGPRGVRTTAGIPGTGIHYSKHHSHGGPSNAGKAGRQQAEPVQQAPRTPAERNLFRAVQLTMEGDRAGAISLLMQAAELTDAAWIAGAIHLADNRPADAIAPLEAAFARAHELGQASQRLGISSSLNLDITPEFQLQIPPGREGAVLALVEALQGAGDPVRALRVLQSERATSPDNPLLALSYAELAWDTWQHDARALEAVVLITDGFDNESAVHAAVLLYRCRALRELGQLESAREVILRGTRRTKDRPNELLLALRYERALVHELLGENAAARKELARIHADKSQYLDVAERLRRI